MKFSKDTIYFTAHNIPILGNLSNGTIIGLDSMGEDFVQKILKDEFFFNDMLSKNELALFNELKNEGFFYESNIICIDSAYIHLTSHCNLKCKGCYSLEKERNTKIDLSFEQICIILKNLKKSGIKTLVLSGGEPFLRKDIKKILYFAKNTLKIENIIAITNGTIDLNIYKSCSGLIDVLALSIDGYHENISFIRDKKLMPKILNIADKLRNYFNIQFISTLHRKNIKFIDKYIDLSNKLQIPLNFSLFTVPINNVESKDFILQKEDFKYLASLIEKNRNICIEDSPLSGNLGCRNSCGAGKNLVSISANGDIYPCHMFHHEKFKMGNALNDDILDSVYKNLKSSGTVSSVSVDFIKSCSNCENKYLCGGGCRFRSYAYENNIYGQDPACIGYLAEYKHIFNKLLND